MVELGVGGDDGADLIEALRKATGAKLRDFDVYRYFGDEAAFSRGRGTGLTMSQMIEIVEADLAH